MKPQMIISYEELVYIADSVYREIVQANKDDGQLVHAVLDKFKYDNLSEECKLFVLTHSWYNDKKLSLCDVYQMERCASEMVDDEGWMCHHSWNRRVRTHDGFLPQPGDHFSSQAMPPPADYMAPPAGSMAPPPMVNMAPLPPPVGYIAPPPVQAVGYMALPPPFGYMAPPAPVGNMAPPPVGNMAQPPLVGNMAPPPVGNMAQPPLVGNMDPPPVGNMAQPPPVGNMAPPPVQAAGYMAPSPLFGYMAQPPTIGNMALPPPVWNMVPPPVGYMCPTPPGGYIIPPPVKCMARLEGNSVPPISNVNISPLPVEDPLWKYIIISDKVNCMKALLSRTPLCAIHKENIPPEISWIKCGEWMQHVLASRNARWNSSQTCCYDDDGEESRKVSQFDALKQIAFTMHAAELFSHCCKFNAMRCMQFLLDKAPHLIHMKAASGHNRLALTTALLYMSPITNDLLERGAVVGREDNAFTLAAIYKKRHFCHRNIRQATELLCHGNEDVISQFECEDSPGCTLLHLLYKTFGDVERPLPKLKDTVFCTKQFIKSGVDPTKEACCGTALNVLLKNLLQYRLPSIMPWHHYESSKHALVAQNLSACMQILLPIFKGKPPGDVDLPASLMDLTNVSHQTICMEFIKQLQLVLDNGLCFNVIRSTFLDLNMFLNFQNTNPCSVCAPAIRLLFTLLCNQPDHNEEKVFLKEIVDRVTDSITGLRLSLLAPDGCHAQDGQECVLHECCFWEMFELIVLAGSNRCNVYHFLENMTRSTIESSLCRTLTHITMHSVHVKNGCPVFLERLARLVKIGWIHFTSTEYISYLETYIGKLADSATNDNTRIVAEELYEFTRNVLPLKTLTRQCIVQHVMWTDIKHLPLPTALKVYVRLGELSADHPVLSMSKAQLAGQLKNTH